jgi:hypothetical protein
MYSTTQELQIKRDLKLNEDSYYRNNLIRSFIKKKDIEIYPCNPDIYTLLSQISIECSLTETSSYISLFLQSPPRSSKSPRKSPPRSSKSPRKSPPRSSKSPRRSPPRSSKSPRRSPPRSSKSPKRSPLTLSKSPRRSLQQILQPTILIDLNDILKNKLPDSIYLIYNNLNNWQINLDTNLNKVKAFMIDRIIDKYLYSPTESTILGIRNFKEIEKILKITAISIYFKQFINQLIKYNILSMINDNIYQTFKKYKELNTIYLETTRENNNKLTIMNGNESDEFYKIFATKCLNK